MRSDHGNKKKIDRGQCRAPGILVYYLLPEIEWTSVPYEAVWTMPEKAVALPDCHGYRRVCGVFDVADTGGIRDCARCQSVVDSWRVRWRNRSAVRLYGRLYAPALPGRPSSHLRADARPSSPGLPPRAVDMLGFRSAAGNAERRLPSGCRR